MKDHEEILEAMAQKVADFHATNMENVTFPSGLQSGTEWEEGYDYQADYELRDESSFGNGQVFWSFVSQEAYL